MTVFDLVFLLSVLICTVSVVGMVIALFTGRRHLLRSIGFGLAIYLGLYALTFVIVALLSPQEVVALHEPRCFDDWCLAVENVEQTTIIGETAASGNFYLVTVQVSNRGRGRSQRERDVAVYVLDANDRR